MKIITLITLLFLGIHSAGQNNSLFTKVFSDTSNFDIMTSTENVRPKVLYVLNRTEKWNEYRFQIDEDLTSDSVRRKLEDDEHSPYNHSYLFKDSLLDQLFSKAEKDKLYRQALSIEPRQLTGKSSQCKLTTFENTKDGFFFSLTDPIFTSDGKYAFIDIYTLKRDEDTKELRDTYFGTTLLIYQNIKGKGWTRIKKRDLQYN
jgi:hypothetical protein